ncbi:hypothetical protein [Halopelagius longus]|uniref:Uncharacterized protein n=1 Tax=Halopelagius longus TaxID=1236180 RepID=A0A1H1BP80_9EURY|nr:hypothetical protein [Halopelagius longus]RDI70858.1 hypothetical protein DWB78_03460 [Halopelagius longus]SDQ53550.1 hypothetical protein SAMN05216278_1878 [Halopelagius longus]
MRPPLHALLLGRESDASRRAVALAAVLGVAVFAAYELVLHSALGGAVWYPYPVAGVAVAAAAAHAYRNDGLLVCWVVGLCPTVGYDLYHFGGLEPTPAGSLLLAATSPSLLVGLAYASLGFVAGATLSRLAGAVRPATDAV